MEDKDDEFKFRVWDERRKKMLYFSAVRGDAIMSCIGKDKNGKDVYVGDVIRRGKGYYTIAGDRTIIEHGTGHSITLMDKLKVREVVKNIYEDSERKKTKWITSRQASKILERVPHASGRYYDEGKLTKRKKVKGKMYYDKAQIKKVKEKLEGGSKFDTVTKQWTKINLSRN